MSARRYADAVRPTVAWLELEHRGWGAVVAPATEERAVAAALASQVARPVIELGADAQPGWFEAAADAGGAFVVLAPGLDDAARARVLVMLNEQRDRTSDRGVWTLIVSARDLAQVRDHARDLASVLRSIEPVEFVPRPLSDDELRAARAELHAHYQRRFGRLDLRGFIRSEQEDVSFAVEAIYQPLQASGDVRLSATFTGFDRATTFPLRLSLVEHLRMQRLRPALLVGGPGAGKSFFLRWSALTASGAATLLGIDAPVPIYVPLAVTRGASTALSIEELIIAGLLESGLTIAHAVASEAAAGRAIFLLDGLDEVGADRQAVADGVTALAARYPNARVVVTSRPTGLEGCRFDADRLDIEGLDDDAIRALLAAWCELYEIQRVGPDGATAGKAEGVRLADEVLSSPTLRELARSPLLATIVAIVHRAGVRLPDHRVELYDHIVRILVERWNQLRSRDVDDAGQAIRTPDAVRLLGPVALDMIRSGRDGGIDEASLRDVLARQLARGTIRGLADPDDALAVFRNSLGLLVEQAPGVYGFLHKTLGEFLAAHELVRTGQFEALIATPATCTDPRWREVILLALGIVGTLRAEDERLAAAVQAIVAVVHARRPLGEVPDAELLGAIIVDDPSLAPATVDAIADELIPFWWLDSIADRDGPDDTIGLVGRIARGRWRTMFITRLERRYGRGTRQPILDEPSGIRAIAPLFTLWAAGRVVAGHVCEWLVAALVSPRDTVHAIAIDIRPGDAAYDALERRGVLGRVSTHRDVHMWGGTGVVLRVPVRRADRLALLPDLLAAWREVAAEHPDGPQPPGSVEEAIAIYGPPADNAA